MSREIKFRAWDGEYMYNSSSSSKGRDFNYPWGFQTGFKDIELMQYTGLKDKNGKEIYEGDICKPANEYMDHFGIGECKLYSKQNHHVWLPNGKSHNYTDGSDWLVIGNIHQDKHLLNQG